MTTPGGENIGEAHIEVDADTDPAQHALTELSHSLDDGSRDTDRFSFSLRGLGRTVGVVGPALGKFGLVAGAVGSAAGTVVPLLAGIVTALENIAPAGAVAATGLVAIQEASIAVKLGMVGIQDAVTAALDPTKAKNFDKAIENLAPNARAFAKELKSLSPELQKVQQGVQNRLFKDFGVALDVLSKTILPTVRTNLNQTADTLNKMALGAAGAALQLAENGALGRALAGANTGLTHLVGIPAQVVTALGELAAAGAPAFAQLTAAVEGVATRISTRLSDAFKSGALQDSVNTAVGLLKGLGDIVGNVFGTIKNVLGSVSGEGGGAFTALTQITQALQDATATQGFQQAMQALAQTMGVVGKVLGGTVGDLLKSLGPVFTSLAGPVQSLVQTLGTALGPVITALADTFTVLGTTVGPILGSALASLSPVLVALAGPLQVLISNLGAGLGPIIDALGPVLLSAANAVGALAISFAPLLPVIGNLIAALLPALTPLLDAVAQLFTSMAPVILQVGSILTAVLAPIIASLPAILQPLIDNITQVSAAMLPVVSTVLTALAPALTSLAKTFADLLVAVAPLLVIVSGLAADLLVKLTPVITPLIQLVGRLAGVFVGILASAINNVVVPAVHFITALFRGDLPGAIHALGAAVTGIGTHFNNIFRAVKTVVSDTIGTVIGILRGMGDRALRAMGNLGATLFNAGKSLIQGFIDGIKSQLGAVRSAASSAAKAARNFFGFSPAKEGPLAGRGWTLYSGEALALDFAKGITRNQAAVRSAVGSLVGTASLPTVRAGDLSRFLTTPSSGSASPTLLNNIRVGAAESPKVTVMIGNQVVRDYVRVVVDQANDQAAREQIQGVRR